MRKYWILALVVMLWGCSSAGDSNSVGLSRNLNKPYLHPSLNRVSGTVTQPPKLGGDRPTFELARTVQEPGTRVIILISDDIPTFIDNKGTIQKASIKDIIPGDTIFAYPDGMVSDVSPLVFKPDEIIIVR